MSKKKSLDEEIEKIGDIDKSKKKIKLKKSVIILGLIFIISSIFGLVAYFNYQKKEEKKRNDAKYIADVKNHYNEFVKVIKDSNLYIKDGNKYEKIGMIYQDYEMVLDETIIDLNTKYFKIKNKDYYIEYENVSKIDGLEEKDSRYKKYIPFNLNVVTNDNFTLYDKDKKVISFDKSMSFPIIIKEYNDKYFVEYDNSLFSIKKEDVKEVVKNDNSTKKNQSRITTLAYHRVYDTNEKCTDPYICIKKSSFDQEMKYLYDNNYFTLTMEEMYLYMTGKIQVEKAITITFDDGYLYQSAVDVLKKYDMKGTMFIITGRFKDMSVFKNDQMMLQSHTDNFHNNYKCPGGYQGGAILCASEKAIEDDLNNSIKKLETEPFALAFPFYDYNDKAIKVLKKVGFKMSFIGRGSTNGRATPNKTDLYKIPRMTVWEQSIMSFNQWKSYL